MKKIALIQTWLGPLPNYFKEHIITCSQQEKIDFFIFTDQVVNDVSYPNIFINHITKEGVEERISNCLNKDIKLFSPYHTNNLKASYGDLYKEYVKGYDYVGCYDIDTLMGDLYNWVLPYLGEFDFISTGGRNFHNRISGPFLIWKNVKTLNTFYKLFNNPSLEVTLSNPSFYAFEEGEFAKRVMDEYKVKIIYNSQNLSEDNGKVTFDAIWDNGKVYCNEVEIMFHHFINKNHTTFHHIDNKIYVRYDKNFIEDFYWVFGFTENYSQTIPHLMDSINNYSNRKCVIYSINFDYKIPNKFLTSKQFIFKKINIEEGSKDSRGRDENIISCKPKLMLDVLEFLPNKKFIFIDSDVSLTTSADDISRYFSKLTDYPLINSHIHDVVYLSGIIKGEDWTSPLHILANKVGVDICVFPRRKTNIMMFDNRSKWFFQEQIDLYHGYKGTEPGIFTLHDEDSANLLLSKYKLFDNLHLCDIEQSNDVTIDQFKDKTHSFHMTGLSESLVLPKHENDIVLFHGLKDEKRFKDIKKCYGNKVLDCEEILVTYNDNSIFFKKNSFLTDKIINENVDFIVKDLNGKVITRLNNQELLNYFVFYISDIILSEGLYIIEIIKTNSKIKIYNNLLKILNHD
jgi:hypothetical protein